MIQENKDPREINDFEITLSNGGLKISTGNGYGSWFFIDQGPTGNCQLSSAVNFCNIMNFLDKYKIRDLFIKIRRSHFYTKRILLLDLNRKHAIKVIEWLAPGCVIGNMPYNSTNGSEMNIILLKLSLVRQLQLPK